jgi:hypothetical protein
MPPVPKPKKKPSYNPPSPPHWKGRDSLDLVYQLNERCLKLLCEAAAGPEPCAWPALAHHRELWSTLRADALQCTARIPFVILDVYFSDEKWWREVVNESPASAERSSSAHQWPRYQWPGSVAADLIQEALIFAWHTVKWDRRVARLSLGMVPAVAESIASLTPQQLATIAGDHSDALRLRWYDHPGFWPRLLRAARGGDEEGVAEIHLHAKLLVMGELTARSALAKIPARE